MQGKAQRRIAKVKDLVSDDQSASPDQAASGAGPRNTDHLQEKLVARLIEATAAADSLVETAITLAAREILNQESTDLKRTQLRLATAEGLAQVIDDKLEIRTKVCGRLSDLLQRMKGGSVGIAGPRGAGKSTVIRRFVDGREKIGDRPLLAALIPAPVAYDSRDFMLHLFAEICRKAGAVPPPPEPRRTDGPRPSGWPVSGWLVAWLPLVALLLTLGGAAGLLASLIHGDRDLIIWGAGVALAGSAVAVYLRRFLRPLRLIPTLIGGLSVLAGSLLIREGFREETVSGAAVEAAALLAFGLILLAVLQAPRRALARNLSEQSMDDDHRSWPPDSELARVASSHLFELRYQQSYTSGLSGAIKLPVAEFGGTTERTLARHAMSFPEVVDGFGKFLSLARKTHDVLIAIDELDKLRSDDDTADRFLNDLKAAFGVPDTYFLVSVSEEAMSRFERRGLPFRDVFDSTFDEIIRVPPLELDEAQALLAQRIVGLPYIYSGLCHVLSGGIPRDLIRMARRLVVVNADPEVQPHDELAPIAKRLVSEELESKTHAVEVAAGTVDASDKLMDQFLVWLGTFQEASETDEMTLPVGYGEGALPWDSGDASFDGEGARGGEELLRLATELQAYGYFAATVLDVFGRPLTTADIDKHANGATKDPTLEQLACARMAFGVTAESARRGVTAFRLHAKAGAVPTPAPRKDEASRE